MRKFIPWMAVLLLASLLCGCAGQGGADAPGAFTLQDGTRIDYTMNREQVEQIVGEPAKIDTESLDHGYVECFYEEEGYYAMYTPEGAIRAFKIDSTEIETFGGIHVMHKLAKVAKAYPKCQSTEVWTLAAFRGTENISADSHMLDENCFWIYYLPDGDANIRRIILMDHTFITEGK